MGNAADQLGSNLGDGPANVEEAVKAAEESDAHKGKAPKAKAKASTTDVLMKQYPAPDGVDEYYWIQLEPNDDIPPTGQFVSHNGRGYLIRTGEPVRIPWFIKGILDDAVQNLPIVDPNTRQIAGHRERRRFDYRLVDEPKDEADAA